VTETPALDRTNVGRGGEGRHPRFEAIDELQAEMDKYFVAYKRKHPCQSRRMNGRTRWETFQEGVPHDPITSRRAEGKVPKAARVTPSRIAGTGTEGCQAITISVQEAAQNTTWLQKSLAVF